MSIESESNLPSFLTSSLSSPGKLLSDSAMDLPPLSDLPIQVSSEDVQFAEASKAMANEFFSSSKYEAAIVKYTEAISYNPMIPGKRSLLSKKKKWRISHPTSLPLPFLLLPTCSLSDVMDVDVIPIQSISFETLEETESLNQILPTRTSLP